MSAHRAATIRSHHLFPRRFVPGDLCEHTAFAAEPIAAAAPLQNGLSTHTSIGRVGGWNWL